MVIGITNTEANYHNYPRWIKGDDEVIEVKTLTPENIEDLEKCDGIVLSGVVDTHPGFYKNDNLRYPNAPDAFDEKRDQFELDIFRFACKKNVPLLAVCRGMQLVNIALGGDILQDIEASGKNNHRKQVGADGIHGLTISIDSLLFTITENEKGEVNSAHHQALGTLAPDLAANAWSPDGLVEGVEWKNKTGKNFLLGVQWHPERLGDLQPGNPLSKNIRDTFLKEVMSKMI